MSALQSIHLFSLLRILKGIIKFWLVGQLPGLNLLITNVSVRKERNRGTITKYATMKKLCTILLISLISSNIFGQDIEKNEDDLLTFRGDITYLPKINTARALLKKDSLNYTAIKYILSYYEELKIDSASLFLDNIIKTYTDKAAALIIRTNFLNFEHKSENRSDNNKWKVFYLDSAYRINKTNTEVLFLLSKVYYADFIYPREKEYEFRSSLKYDPVMDSVMKSLFKNANEKVIKKSTFKYAADSALLYFYRLWQCDTGIRSIIYYPIKQLEYYLHQEPTFQISGDDGQGIEQSCIPVSYFANLKDNWQCDSTVNYLYTIEAAAGTANRLKSHLENLNEPCLYNTAITGDTKILRFTWLRSFHHPISIRLEKTKNKTILIWKEGKGMGGYSPEGLKRKGKKKITRMQWDKLSALLEKHKIDTLPNKDYIPMMDGATWTLEKKDLNGYKAHNTNSPSEDFKKICLYLLKLSKLKIKKARIY